MIIFLHGLDDYRREERRRVLVAEFLKKHSPLGLSVIDFEEEGGAERLKEHARLRSLFTSGQLIVIEHLDAAGDVILESAQLLSNIKETTLLFSEREVPSGELAMLAKKPSLVEHIPHLHDVGWETFIKKEAEHRGFALTSHALRFLAELYEEDAWRLITELDVLCLLGHSPIMSEDLERRDLELTPDVWALVRGLSDARCATRLRNLERLLAMREPAAKLFNILSAGADDRTPLFAAYDVQIKSGKLEYDEALLDSVLV